MKRFNMFLSDQQQAHLCRLTEETGISRSEHIRRAVDLYLQSRNERIQPNLRQRRRRVRKTL